MPWPHPSGSRAAAVIAAACLLAACSPRVTGPPQTDGPSKTATQVLPEVVVGEMLDAWHRAAAVADEDGYFAHFTADAVFLGTDGSERRSVPELREFAHPLFARGEVWALQATRRSVVVAESGEIAWFDEDLATADQGTARGSGVAKRQGERWKIAHYNLTRTEPKERVTVVSEPLVALVGLLVCPGVDSTESNRGVGELLSWEPVDGHGHTGDPSTLVRVGRAGKRAPLELETELTFIRPWLLEGDRLAIVGQRFGDPRGACTDGSWCLEVWDLEHARRLLRGARATEFDAQRLRAISYPAALVWPLCRAEHGS